MASGTWIRIAETSARMAFERIEHDGVGVLCVRLEGSAARSADEVGAIRDALDDLGATIEPPVDVATLDVTRFASAPGDEASILTTVFRGLPCCWITREWARQRGGDRWDLPRPEQLAATRDEAIARVVSWRRAGEVTLGGHDGSTAQALRWTERGLVSREHGDQDLHHRNRLVERRIGGARPCTISWPLPDATGAPHEALRRGARLVRVGHEIVEADFSPCQTGRPLAEGWVEALAGLPSVRTLVLGDAAPDPADVQRAVRTLPKLEELVLNARTPLMQRVLREIRRTRGVRVR